MIKLIYPHSDQKYYFFEDGTLFGPFTLLGVSEPEVFSRRLSDDTLEERDGVWGENDVEHVKFDGVVHYVPALSPSYTTAPSPPPWVSRVPVTLHDGNRWVDTFAVGGIARDNTSLVHLSSTNAVYQKAFRRISPNQWIYASVAAYRTKPRTVTSYSVHLLTLSPHNGKTIRVDVTRIFYPVQLLSQTGSFDWTVLQSVNTIFGLEPKRSTVSEYKEVLQLPVWSKAPVLSPASILNTLVMYNRWDMLSQNTLQPIDYGELAMRASSKVIANNVNMLAFLGDLKKIPSLIPKLKNLHKLKTYGNNYLSYKYGVLPTISDLSAIRDAVLRRKPYLDSNGFKTYNARTFTSEQTGIYSVSLEQRIKLAIDTEDNSLHGFIQALENIGMFPTFENVWDLIPYSFVLDWFTGIGDWLERIDTRLRLTRLNIRYVTMSLKRTATIDAAFTGLPLIGWIGKVHYHRWVSDQCPVPSAFSNSKPEAFNHWLEAGALLLQRTD